MNIAKRIFHAVFPQRCACCNRRINSDKMLCDGCESHLPIIRSRICTHCAMPRSQCECRAVRHEFDGVCAPFLYRAAAKKLVLNIKCRLSAYAVKYAAEMMIKTLFCYFGDERFDIITFVPTDMKTRSEKGGDHAEAIAKEIGRRTCIDFERLLIQKGKKRPQHTLTAAQRRKNVEGIYEAARHLNGGTILLIDDICTTGATLSECAKTLKAAGAERVICCVAARSAPENKTENE